MTAATTFLPVFRKNALYENEQRIPKLRAGEVSATDVLQVCRNYRVAGICSLLLSASTDDFHRFLSKSSAAFAWCTARRVPSFTLVRALPPLLDALCRGESSTAATIANHVGASWDSSSEYEEDFLYARFLCSHFLEPSDSKRDEYIVSRYSLIVGDSEDPRLAVMNSFVQQDEVLFEQGLETLLAKRAARYQRLAAKESLPLWEVATEGCVSIEGLALVALAERKGFRTRADYLHVPAIARLQASIQSSPVNWENVRA
jgi:hypothetical protein